MNYKFKVGDLVKVGHTGDLALVIAYSPGRHLPYYQILIQGDIQRQTWEYELRKVSENNEL